MVRLIWFDKPIINRTGQSGRQPFSTDINFHQIFQIIGSSTKSLAQTPEALPAKNAKRTAKNRNIAAGGACFAGALVNSIPVKNWIFAILQCKIEDLVFGAQSVLGKRMSNFSDMMTYLGLDTSEAAMVLNVSEDEILRWCNTSEAPPIHIWQGLVRMLDEIRLSAEEAAKSADLDHLDATDLNRINLMVPGGTTSDLAGPKRAATALAVATLARVFV